MNETNSTPSPLPLAPLALDELLSLLGFLLFDLIMFQLVMPSLGVSSAFFCFLSVLVFFSRKQSSKDFQCEPIYVYFKVIAIIYLIHSLAIIPHGFCFTAKYFPQMNCQACVIFQLVYIPFSNIFFHYTGMLEIAIILDRMKVRIV